jgi:hypothetical protein
MIYSCIHSIDCIQIFELYHSDCKDSVLNELISAVDKATLESVALGSALFAGIEFAKPKVSLAMSCLSH